MAFKNIANCPRAWYHICFWSWHPNYCSWINCSWWQSNPTERNCSSQPFSWEGLSFLVRSLFVWPGLHFLLLPPFLSFFCGRPVTPLLPSVNHPRHLPSPTSTPFTHPSCFLPTLVIFTCPRGTLVSTTIDWSVSPPARPPARISSPSPPPSQLPSVPSALVTPVTLKMGEHWLLKQLSLNHPAEHIQQPKLAKLYVRVETSTSYFIIHNQFVK